MSRTEKPCTAILGSFSSTYDRISPYRGFGRLFLKKFNSSEDIMSYEESIYMFKVTLPQIQIIKQKFQLC